MKPLLLIFLGFELKYLTLSKLKLSKSSIWCKTFKTSAKREVSKNYLEICPLAVLLYRFNISFLAKVFYIFSHYVYVYLYLFAMYI